MVSSTALVIGPHHAAEWRSGYERGERATAMPYGAELLGTFGYRVTYAQPFGSGWIGRVNKFLARVFRALTNRPLWEIACLAPRILTSDLLVSFFEDNAALLRPLLIVRRWLPRRTSVVI